jgi:hypothetical protein
MRCLGTGESVMPQDLSWLLQKKVTLKEVIENSIIEKEKA